MVTIAEINNQIIENKEYCNDFWVGILYSKKIGNYELLNKEEENKNGRE